MLLLVEGSPESKTVKGNLADNFLFSLSLLFRSISNLKNN